MNAIQELKDAVEILFNYGAITQVTFEKLNGLIIAVEKANPVEKLVSTTEAEPLCVGRRFIIEEKPNIMKDRFIKIKILMLTDKFIEYEYCNTGIPRIMRRKDFCEQYKIAMRLPRSNREAKVRAND